MSAVGMPLLQSPGCNEGKARNETLGFAGVSPLQGSLSDWAFAVLCRGIVFVKCVWVCKWIVAFVKCVWGVNGLLRSFVFLYLFDFDCIVCCIGD